MSRSFLLNRVFERSMPAALSLLAICIIHVLVLSLDRTPSIDISAVSAVESLDGLTIHGIQENPRCSTTLQLGMKSGSLFLTFTWTNPPHGSIRIPTSGQVSTLSLRSESHCNFVQRFLPVVQTVTLIPEGEHAYSNRQP